MRLSARYVKPRGAVYLVVSHQSKEAMHKLFELPAKNWNNKEKLVKKNHPDSHQLNRLILDTFQVVARIVRAYQYRTAAEVGNHIKKWGFKMAPAYADTTVNFIQKELEHRAFDNVNSLRTMMRWVAKYDPTIKINAWTKIKVEDFEHFLRSQPTLKSDNTISRYLIDLRTMLNRAVYLDVITPTENPFSRGYKIKSISAKDVKLEIAELRKLAALAPQDYAARFYMLMYFLDGARPNEALKLKWSDIRPDCVSYKQSKTAKSVNVSMTPQLAEILSLYREDGVYIVDNMNRSTMEEKRRVASVLAVMNKNLKKACKVAGIKEVTCHTARHTFAYLADEAGYTITELQSALNHSKPEITSKYIGRLRRDRMAGKRKELHKLL